MFFNFSKSKFVACCSGCNKYAWLDVHKPNEKAEVSDFTESLMENGRKVGALAKQYFNVDADVTVLREDGTPDTYAMVAATQKHIALGTKYIAEASFDFGGLFCSVDILERNDDGSYNINEVKSAKIQKPKKSNVDGVDTTYVIDAAYQQYVLEKCGIRIKQVFVVLLSDTYVRGKNLELDKYFVRQDVTEHTNGLQDWVKEKLAEIEVALNSLSEPPANITPNCKGCDYFGFCSKCIPVPSPFDIYNLKFSRKCELYNKGISFFDAPDHAPLKPAALKQIEYYNRPNDVYIDRDEIKAFLDSLRFPLYSLDFETYQAIVPEHEGMKTDEAIPFQYSLHIMKVPDGDYSDGGADLEESHFLDVSGGDPRRAIAESIVKDIPFGACIVACHKSTESHIIARLAELYPDLSAQLMSYEYVDPQPLFQNGYYYVNSMGGSFSLKSILPALYPDDPNMDYHNLDGEVKNGMQAMNAIAKIQILSADEAEKLRQDLIQYCALDTFAVVKILKKLYDVVK